DDLADARSLWIKDGDDPSADFLLEFNAAGERLDWHSLRHTTGAWLVAAGVDIKTVQVTMRHSSIKLTLDTYGHLMPGAKAAALGTMAETFGSAPPQEPTSRRVAQAG
ncbi:MAG: tyrosine-type recombinase/integrase, partial [Planctomycetota bacterium]